MIELAAILVALGTFTGYITGRARGYHLGYSDAQKIYERAIQNLWSEQ